MQPSCLEFDVLVPFVTFRGEYNLTEQVTVVTGRNGGFYSVSPGHHKIDIGIRDCPCPIFAPSVPVQVD